jgi:translation initiation factor 1
VRSTYHRAVSESRRVYSTAEGDLRKERDRPGRRRGAAAAPTPDDGVVRVSRETSGRRGKVVTVVRGIPSGDVSAIASELKRLCGSGGAAKNGVVELQGDHRTKAAARLEELGYRVRLAGG